MKGAERGEVQRQYFIITGDLESVAGVVVGEGSSAGYISFHPRGEGGQLSPETTNLRIAHHHAERALLMHQAHLSFLAVKGWQQEMYRQAVAEQPSLFPDPTQAEES